MNKIQWFPGHMTRAMRDMKEEQDLCDGVICVLDARAPAATFNPNLKKVFGNKPIVYVLNKSDLSDERTDGFVRLIESKGKLCLKTNGLTSSCRRSILNKMTCLIEEKLRRAEAKGVVRTYHFMVAGIPNTGKSSLINLLSGEKKAKTGDKAGVTRDTRWIHCQGFDLLDTPGTMPPSMENQTLARHLAFIGSINDAILHTDDVALALLEELAQSYPKALSERYQLTDLSTPLVILEGVCKRMGFLLRGGDYDYERGEKAVIDDFRKGRIGKICLEKASEYADLDF